MTKATAIAISESTGAVTIFKNGKIFMSIEKPIGKISFSVRDEGSTN